ncbi:MAG: phosphoribosyltransferase family protein [Nitrospira sp.]|nr:phosphoribosyltransferase family protein [Nitrospira sp.]
MKASTDLVVNVIRRMNTDTRDYKVLMNASGDTVQHAIIPSTIHQIAARMAMALETTSQPDYIVGFAPGGIPIAMALSFAVNVPAVIAYKCRLDLPGELVWSEPHCQNSTFYFYGAHPGMSVILVDDEVDSGATLAGAIEALRGRGVEILAVASVVEVLHTSQSRGRQRLATLGLDLKSLQRFDVDCEMS